MLKSLKAHSSNSIMATPQIDASVENCLIKGHSVPLKLYVGRFVTVVVSAEISIEETTIGERVLLLACHSMFISCHLSLISSFHLSLFSTKVFFPH